MTAALSHRPLAKAWLVEQLGAKDFGHGVPEVPKPPNPAQNGAFYADQFDSESSDYSFQIEVDGVIIRLMTAPMLPRQLGDEGFGTLLGTWYPKWKASWVKQGQATKVSISCPLTGRKVGHPSVRAFFQFFCTGQVQCVETQTSVGAEDLLILATHFQIPYLKNAAEVALRRFVSTSTFCHMLCLADTCQALQLKRFCLLFAAHSHELLDRTDVRKLPSRLRTAVQQALEAAL